MKYSIDTINSGFNRKKFIFEHSLAIDWSEKNTISKMLVIKLLR